jgi:hypothetical protein
LEIFFKKLAKLVGFTQGKKNPKKSMFFSPNKSLVPTMEITQKRKEV